METTNFKNKAVISGQYIYTHLSTFEQDMLKHEYQSLKNEYGNKTVDNFFTNLYSYVHSRKVGNYSLDAICQTFNIGKAK